MNDVMKIFSGAIKEVLSFIDTADKKGWLIYTIIGLVLLFLYIMIFA